MTRFCAIYTGRLLGHTMKSMSFPISDTWLIKVATYVSYIIALFLQKMSNKNSVSTRD